MVAVVASVGLLACRAESADKSGAGWRRMLAMSGVTEERLVAAMEKVRRADYLPADQVRHEFEDRPLEIGHGQTTSQPTLIAQMVQAMDLKPGCRVLEVGTGSGYQTALLAELCDHVYSIDIVEPLALEAKRRLEKKGYRNAFVKAGDGYLGWPEAAPFDGIVVCAAAAQVPKPLVEQLKPGGRLVIPVGERYDTDLKLLVKAPDGTVKERVLVPVSFVPLTGPHADADRREKRR